MTLNNQETITMEPQKITVTLFVNLHQTNYTEVSEWVSSFLTALQHNIGYTVPYR